MPWNLNSERPIYSQIIEKIQRDILAGIYLPGEKLPSVRELATQASVNPNTMQKALSELERTGILYSQRTAGRFITEDQQLILKLKEALAKEEIKTFLANMQQLGFQKEEVLTMIERTLQKPPYQRKTGELHDSHPAML